MSLARLSPKLAYTGQAHALFVRSRLCCLVAVTALVASACALGGGGFQGVAYPGGKTLYAAENTRLPTLKTAKREVTPDGFVLITEPKVCNFTVQQGDTSVYFPFIVIEVDSQSVTAPLFRFEQPGADLLDRAQAMRTLGFLQSTALEFCSSTVISTTNRTAQWDTFFAYEAHAARLIRLATIDYAMRFQRAQTSAEFKQIDAEARAWNTYLTDWRRNATNQSMTALKNNLPNPIELPRGPVALPPP